MKLASRAPLTWYEEVSTSSSMATALSSPRACLFLCRAKINMHIMTVRCECVCVCVGGGGGLSI